MTSTIPKIIYVCAPLGGRIYKHIGEAIEYSRFVFKCGAIPIVPHFFAFSLNDKIPEERNMGLVAGRLLLLYCDEMWIFGEHITEGMVGEMKLCEETGIHMRHINKKEFLDVLGGKNNEQQDT